MNTCICTHAAAPSSPSSPMLACPHPRLELCPEPLFASLPDVLLRPQALLQVINLKVIPVLKTRKSKYGQVSGLSTRSPCKIHRHQVSQEVFGLGLHTWTALASPRVTLISSVSSSTRRRRSPASRRSASRCSRSERSCAPARAASSLRAWALAYREGERGEQVERYQDYPGAVRPPRCS